MNDLYYFFAAYCLGWALSHAILIFKRVSEVST